MSEYYAVIRSTDHLAHYGVKGMKWGVRKAIARGDSKKLNKHFRKATKKLAKLQDIGLNSKKYAAKAAAYGAAAAGTGTIAVGGTKFASKYIKAFANNPIVKHDPAIRIGAGAITAGLAGKSAQNAYRASHGSKYRKKAYEFKNAMDEVFSGTKYEGKYVVQPKRRKKKRTKG